jgi:hypothetical protein
MKKLSRDELRAKAQDTLKRLAGICEDEDLAEAKDLVEALRDEALYEEMGALAEAVSRRDPKDARNRRLYGQYLINTGKATVAIDLLTPLAQRLEKGDPEFAEAMGLIGRANKQIFFDAGDKADPSAHAALGQALAAYRVPFEESPEKNTWHGVNLLALLYRARRLGVQIAPDLSPRQVAKSVVAELVATPKEKRHPVWYLPTLAEASLGLGDWDVVEGNVRAYAASDRVRPFQIESTLRQFTEVWDIEALDERGRGLVTTLRARLLQLNGGEIRASAEDVQRWREQAPPTPGQLEAILGSEGPQTYKWWRTGLERASSVCAVRQRLGQRFGSGFLLKAGALGLQPPDELVALTNFHVVNKEGALGALTPETAEVAFEAADANQATARGKIGTMQVFCGLRARSSASFPFPWRRPCRLSRITRRSILSGIPADRTSLSRFRTTSFSIMKGRRAERRNFRAYRASITGRPPSPGAPEARCSTRRVGRSSRCITRGARTGCPG